MRKIGAVSTHFSPYQRPTLLETTVFGVRCPIHLFQNFLPIFSSGFVYALTPSGGSIEGLTVYSMRLQRPPKISSLYISAGMRSTRWIHKAANLASHRTVWTVSLGLCEVQ